MVITSEEFKFFVHFIQLLDPSFFSTLVEHTSGTLSPISINTHGLLSLKIRDWNNAQSSHFYIVCKSIGSYDSGFFCDKRYTVSCMTQQEGVSAILQVYILSA